MTRRVVLIDGFDPTDSDVAVVDAAVYTLTDHGHEVRRISLVADDFTPFMSTEERLRYHDEGDNILTDEVRRSVEAIRWADALLFVYPTSCFNPPARVKAWLDRVLLPGVAFGFDDSGRVAPRLTHVRRLGLITTTGHGFLATARARDGGRRMILRALRMNCAKTCRRSYMRVAPGVGGVRSIRRRLGRW